MRSFVLTLLSALLTVPVPQPAHAMTQVVAGSGSFTPAGGASQSSMRSPLFLFHPGEVAFNRGPSTLPTPPDQLDIHRACSPSPVVVGWKPLPWPKYDSYRDVIFLSKPLQVGYQLYTLAQDGVAAQYQPQGMYGYEPGGVAPVGDGRVYFLGNGVLSYVDSNDVANLVLGPSGVPFVGPGAGSATDMVYDALSNALFVLSSTTGTAGPCTPALYANAVLTKIPLDLTGGTVIGPTTLYTFCAGQNDTYVPRITRHSDGRLLFRVAITGTTSTDVVWLDTLTMTAHWFCTQQNAPGEALTNELAYSEKLGGVVTTSVAPCFFCPTVGRLRLFTEGSTGVGATLCAWVDEYRDTYFELAP